MISISSLAKRTAPEVAGDITPVAANITSACEGMFHRLAYTHWGDEDAELVVCLHGLTRQGRDFDFLARALVARGRRVACPDLPGRGSSDRLLNPLNYDVNQYVIDMTVLIAALRVVRLDWVGTSLGGLVGIMLAGRTNSPIRRLVVNDIGPHINIAAALRIRNNVRYAPRSFSTIEEADRYFRELLAPFGTLSDAQWLHFARHSVRKDRGGGFRMHYDPDLEKAFKTPWRYERDFWNAWDSIRCPVLVLRGATSDILLPHTAQEMLERNPHSTVIDIPHCGHAPALASDAQLDLVANWLTQTSDDEFATRPQVESRRRQAFGY